MDFPPGAPKSTAKALINQLLNVCEYKVLNRHDDHITVQGKHGDLDIEVNTRREGAPEWTIHVGSAEMINMQDIFLMPNSYIRAADAYFGVIRGSRFSEEII